MDSCSWNKNKRFLKRGRLSRALESWTQPRKILHEISMKRSNFCSIRCWETLLGLFQTTCCIASATHGQRWTSFITKEAFFHCIFLRLLSPLPKLWMSYVCTHRRWKWKNWRKMKTSSRDRSRINSKRNVIRINRCCFLRLVAPNSK